MILSCDIISGKTDGKGWDFKYFFKYFNLPVSPHRRYLTEKNKVARGMRCLLHS